MPTAQQWTGWFQQKQDYNLNATAITISQTTAPNASFCGAHYFAAGSLNFILPTSTFVPANCALSIIAQGGAVAVQISPADRLNAGPLGTGAMFQQGYSATFYTDANGNWYYGAATGLLLTPQQIGPSSFSTPLAGTWLQVAGPNGTGTRVEVDSYGAPGLFTGVRFDGSRAALTALLLNDEIVAVNGWGFDGVAAGGPAASLHALADENWSPGHHGTRSCLAVTTNGTTSLVDQWCVSNNGGLYASGVAGGAMGNGTINARAAYINGAPVAIQQPQLTGQVNDLATLAATPIMTFVDGVWRSDYSVGFGAPPLYYIGESGTCASKGRINDGGSCVDVAADGNSWVAKLPAILDPREWGVPINPVTLYVDPAGNASPNNYCFSSVQANKCTTATQATGRAYQTCGFYQTMHVNLSGNTFNEDLDFTGMPPCMGGNTPYASATNLQLLQLDGVSGSTLINNVASVGGQSYCYAIGANIGARIGLKNLSVQANATPGTCTQSDLYTNLNGIIVIVSNVTLLSANANLIMEEEQGAIYVTPGGCSCPAGGLILAGNAPYGISIEAQSLLEADTTIQFAGNGQTFSDIIRISNQSQLKLFGNPAVSVQSGSVVGTLFSLSELSVMRAYYPPTNWPGSIGAADGGSRYSGSDDNACTGGATGCVNTTAPTGLGTVSGLQGTAVVTGGEYAGTVALYFGAGAASTGTIGVGFAYWLTGSSGGGVCSWQRVNGTVLWDNASFLELSGPNGATGTVLVWNNNGVVPASGSILYLSYTCQTIH